MTGVSNEALLGQGRRFEAGKHVIHRHGQSRNLVSRFRNGNPLVQIATANALHTCADAIHARHATPHREPGDDAYGKQEERCTQKQQEHDDFNHVLHWHK